MEDSDQDRLSAVLTVINDWKEYSRKQRIKNYLTTELLVCWVSNIPSKYC